MKKTKKQIIDKDIVKKRIAHSSTAPRLEGEVKNARMRSKHKKDVKQIQKPRKKVRGIRGQG